MGVSASNVINRAYSLLTVKSVDAERRLITGIATTPEPDRVGDIVKSKGVRFKNPLPLLLFHDSRLPVGQARLKAATDDGIEFEATLADPGESDVLKARIDEAWASIKAGLIKGVSIGFRVLEDGIEQLKSGSFRFTKIEVMELSLVVIPSNASASIHSIKSLDAPYLAATGTDAEPVLTTSRARGALVVKLRPETPHMKTIAEQIKEYEATRETKRTRMTELMTKSADAGETLDQAQSEEYDTLDGEVASINKHIERLNKLELVNRASAVTVAATTPEQASAVRGGSHPVITVQQNLPAGIGFARAVMVKVVSRLDHRYSVDVAKEMYPSDQRLHNYFSKATIPAGTSVHGLWAGPLVDQTTLESEFAEFLRPQTIIGKFGVDGVPSLRRVPFNIRVQSQTTGQVGYWVGEAKPKPVTNAEYAAATLLYTKVAAISVIAQELARFSSPSAEALVRDGLRDAIVARIDSTLVDPGEAAVANVSPASLTNGLTALSSAGTSADNARTDIQNLLEQFILNNVNPTNVVLVMPNTLALALSVMVNSLGQPEFPGLTMNGGRLMGIPVITSQYAANASGSGNLVIAINASDVFLADDGAVTVDMSTEASLQMSDAPTNDASTGTGQSLVSLWQNNAIALRAERFINWQKRRSSAVVYMDDVNWGSIGSPS